MRTSAIDTHGLLQYFFSIYKIYIYHSCLPPRPQHTLCYFPPQVVFFAWTIYLSTIVSKGGGGGNQVAEEG